jgi:hypothetical protein
MGPLALGTLLVMTFSIAGFRAQARDADSIPRAGQLNRHVLAVIAKYPTDGTHAYKWPKDGSYGGVTQDLVYQGIVVAKGNAARQTYCCGLTFEVFFKAWARWQGGEPRKNESPAAIGELSPKQLRALRQDWYCATGDRTGPVKALVDRQLGVRITKFNDARAGDFVQLWRTSGSGHSVVFLAWERDRQGEIVAMRYWSTQPGTQGISERVERFSGKAALVRDQIYIARAGRGK